MEFKVSRLLIFWILVLIGFSCDSAINKTSSEISDSHKNEAASVSPKIRKTDSTFYPVLDFKHEYVINSSGRKIDLLHNSSDTFPTEKNRIKERLYFRSECLSCAPIKKGDNYLLLAKRLKIYSDSLHYSFENIIDSNTQDIKFIVSLGDLEEKKKRFNFTEGNGSINFIKVSCNDADTYEVKLNYKDGQVIFPYIINPTNFELDIDGDKNMEQFIYSARSCNQELSIFRIR